MSRSHNNIDISVINSRAIFRSSPTIASLVSDMANGGSRAIFLSQSMNTLQSDHSNIKSLSVVNFQPIHQEAI